VLYGLFIASQSFCERTQTFFAVQQIAPPKQLELSVHAEPTLAIGPEPPPAHDVGCGKQALYVS
jgi:hypothetical protein